MPVVATPTSAPADVAAPSAMAAATSRLTAPCRRISPDGTPSRAVFEALE